MSISKNYGYGLLPPTDGREQVLDQIRLGHQYRNKLVEIELDRRAKTDALLHELCPGLDKVEDDLAEATEEIENRVALRKAANKKARAKTVDPEADAALAKLRKHKKALQKERKRLRSDAFKPLKEEDLRAIGADDIADKLVEHASQKNPHGKARVAAEIQRLRAAWLKEHGDTAPIRARMQFGLAEINYEANKQHKAARGDSGLYSGTYLIVDQAAKSFGKGAPPVYRGFRGEGRIGVQLCDGGLLWSDVLAGTDTKLQAKHTPQLTQRVTKSGVTLPMPGAKQQARRYTLKIRVGTDGRTPVWATFPLRLHRPIPDDARVKWAVVHRRVVAGQEYWKLTLTLSGASLGRSDTASTGEVGIDVGYRLKDDGSIRIACISPGKGAEVEFTIDAGKVGQFKKVDDLQAIRADRFNEVKASLKDWLKAHKATVPKWLREETKSLHSWNRQGRLITLHNHWRKARCEDDDRIFATLESWRKKDTHLWQYQEHLRGQLIAWRKDYYRNLARRDIARKYQSVYMEDLDLRDLQDTKRPKDEKDEQEVPSNIRRVARIAALSYFIQYIKEAACTCKLVDPADTTKICSACGELCDWDAAAELRHTCEHCGATWDQDFNAARNILARGQAT